MTDVLKTKRGDFWSNAFLVFVICFILFFLTLSGFLYFRFRSLIRKAQTAIQATPYRSVLATTSVASGSRRDILFAVTDDDPSVGPKNAPVTIVEFSDFQCPFCKKANPVMKQVLKAYPQKIRFIYRDFPISEIHPYAQLAAEAGECAQDQGKFWELHDAIFENQQRLNESALSDMASSVGIKMPVFQECLSTRKYQNEVLKDLSDGANLGVSGTPTFFVNGKMVVGAIPLHTFLRIIEEELKSL